MFLLAGYGLDCRDWFVAGSCVITLCYLLLCFPGMGIYVYIGR